jgi:glycosyltransferase involved in cell wall biosynthesis
MTCLEYLMNKKTKITRTWLNMQQFKNNADISIIIATYNGESTIQNTIYSVLNQSFDDLKLIVVDDGSIDQTALIVNKIDDNRLTFIIQENKGVNSAFNTALHYVDTEYVCFLDHDDLMETDYLKKMIYNITTNECDVAISKLESYFQINDFSGVLYNHNQKHFEIYECSLDFMYAFVKNNHKYSLAYSNKLFKANIIKKLVFPENYFLPDISTIFIALSNSNKVVFDDSIVALHYVNEGSLSRGEISSSCEFLNQLQEHYLNNLIFLYNKFFFDPILVYDYNYSIKYSILSISLKMIANGCSKDSLITYFSYMKFRKEFYKESNRYYSLLNLVINFHHKSNSQFIEKVISNIIKLVLRFIKRRKKP